VTITSVALPLLAPRRFCYTLHIPSHRNRTWLPSHIPEQQHRYPYYSSNMAVIWGLDLKEIQWNKFSNSYMWNNEYHLRRTKFIIYQLAMIFCVVSESLGTAALSGTYLTRSPPTYKLRSTLLRSLVVVLASVTRVSTNISQTMSASKTLSPNKTRPQPSTTTTTLASHRTTSSSVSTSPPSLAAPSSSISSGRSDASRAV
jgi:hypothetical protein